jgi:nucleotide-binding universal stress UspA family protein
VQQLKLLGLPVKGKLVWGEPAREIAAYAREIGADLVVVGHRRQNFFARWWSGSTGATLTDQVDCTILISHNVIADDDFQREFHPAEAEPSS